jgi:transcriptional regulator with XRE-family HTH domain
VAEKTPKRVPKIRNAVGKALKAARVAKGLTQADLAAKLQIYGWDIDRTGWVRVETGERVLSDCELIALVDVLALSLDAIVAVADRVKVRRVLRTLDR